MVIMQKAILTEEINALKVLKGMYEVKLAATNARIGHLITDLMFIEAEELNQKSQEKEGKGCKTVMQF